VGHLLALSPRRAHARSNDAAGWNACVRGGTIAGDDLASAVDA
jgi:hypothetical protein